MELFRVHRLTDRSYAPDGSVLPPEPGNANEAAHVGDYSSYEEALDVARLYGAQYIEPVVFNDDPENPVYTNAGPVVEVS